MNQLTLIGNVGRDPELSYTPNGVAVAKFSFATSYRRSDTKESETTWHNVVAFGKQAEILHQYVSKGSKLFLQGRLTKRQYTTNDGARREWVEMVVEKFEFLSRANERTNDIEDDDDSPFEVPPAGADPEPEAEPAGAKRGKKRA